MTVRRTMRRTITKKKKARSPSREYREEMDGLNDFFTRKERDGIPILVGDYAKLH